MEAFTAGAGGREPPRMRRRVACWIACALGWAAGVALIARDGILPWWHAAAACALLFGAPSAATLIARRPPPRPAGPVPGEPGDDDGRLEACERSVVELLQETQRLRAQQAGLANALSAGWDAASTFPPRPRPNLRLVPRYAHDIVTGPIRTWREHKTMP